jgi:molybdate transport system substrate-binding protein
VLRIEMISAGAARALVEAGARAAGLEVGGSFGAVGAMIEKFLAGEPCDVLILTRAQVDRLAAERRIVAGSDRDLGLVPTSIAVRAGDPSPDVSAAEPLRQALLAADAIYFPDPAKATAGIHFAKVIEQLGIHEAVRERWRVYPSGAIAMRALAEAGGHPIGCTQSSEILSTPGTRLVAPLPPGFDLATVYTAAVSTRAADGAAAAAFVSRLAGDPEARRRAGFG